MHDLSITVEHHEDGKTETLGMIEALQQRLRLPHLGLALRFAWVVVHMDIYEVLCYETVDGGIVGDEIGKFQTPWAPVASHLADDELALALGLFHSLVNLLDGVDILIIHFLQLSLGAGRH